MYHFESLDKQTYSPHHVYLVCWFNCRSSVMFFYTVRMFVRGSRNKLYSFSMQKNIYFKPIGIAFQFLSNAALATKQNNTKIHCLHLPRHKIDIRSFLFDRKYTVDTECPKHLIKNLKLIDVSLYRERKTLLWFFLKIKAFELHFEFSRIFFKNIRWSWTWTQWVMMMNIFIRFLIWI